MSWRDVFIIFEEGVEMQKYRVKPGAKVQLSRIPAGDTAKFDGGKKEGREALIKLNQELDALQELLYAQHQHKILIVLQAMDTGGKDGAIRSVFEGVNPQGVKVVSFKSPTQQELDHDYLWRIHQHVPARGEITIFNRSHYEDLLVVRVHDWVNEEVWQKRFEHINQFERMLAEEGTTILKFYLHIDKDEQKQRLEARLHEPDKHWKFSVNDLEERKLWKKYMRAYQDVLSKTSAEYAPWYIVPANHKWYRNLVIAEILTDTLRNLKMTYPKPAQGLSEIVIE
jgi:PPK2 family polyphosphate:nucleotide phosphotransferase